MPRGAGATSDALVDQGRLRLSMSPLRPIAVAMMASAAFLAEDRRFAGLLYEELLPHAGFAVVMGLIPCTPGPADLQLGCLAALEGRWELAENHFEAAARFEAKLGGSFLGGSGKLYHALMLRMRGAPGDRERMVDLAEDALASSIGAVPVMESEIRKLLRP